MCQTLRALVAAFVFFGLVAIVALSLSRFRRYCLKGATGSKAMSYRNSPNQHNNKFA